MTTDRRFLKHEHIRRSKDFVAVYKRKRSVTGHYFTLCGRLNDLPYTRIGFSVSRKVGIAVVRNRLRRLYREAFRLTKHELPVGMDVVFIPRRPDEPKLAVFQSSLRELLPKLRAVLEKAERKS